MSNQENCSATFFICLDASNFTLFSPYFDDNIILLFNCIQTQKMLTNCTCCWRSSKIAVLMKRNYCTEAPAGDTITWLTRFYSDLVWSMDIVIVGHDESGSIYKFDQSHYITSCLIMITYIFRPGIPFIEHDLDTIQRRSDHQNKRFLLWWILWWI